MSTETDYEKMSQFLQAKNQAMINQGIDLINSLFNLNDFLVDSIINNSEFLKYTILDSHVSKYMAYETLAYPEDEGKTLFDAGKIYLLHDDYVSHLPVLPCNGQSINREEFPHLSASSLIFANGHYYLPNLNYGKS